MRLISTGHAPSIWNECGRTQGHCDTPLSAAGERLAEQLAARRDLDGVRTLITSDLRRAMATAAPLARRLGLTPLPREDCREGRWPTFFHDPAFPLPPCSYGFEDHAAVDARAARFAAWLLAAGLPDPVLLISHGHFQRSLLTHCLGEPAMAGFSGARTALTTLDHDGTTWRLIAMNDDRHLHDHDQNLARLDAG